MFFCLSSLEISGQAVALSFAESVESDVFDVRQTQETVEVCKKQGLEAKGLGVDVTKANFLQIKSNFK